MEVNPIQALLQEMACRRFYGSLTLKFEAGKVVIIKKEETLKPHDLSGQPRTSECKTSIRS